MNGRWRRLPGEERVAFIEAGDFVAAVHAEGDATPKRATIGPDAEREPLGHVANWKRPSLNLETFRSDSDR